MVSREERLSDKGGGEVSKVSKLTYLTYLDEERKEKEKKRVEQRIWKAIHQIKKEDPELYRVFSAIVRVRGERVINVIRSLIEEYVEKHGPQVFSKVEVNLVNFGSIGSVNIDFRQAILFREAEDLAEEAFQATRRGADSFYLNDLYRKIVDLSKKLPSSTPPELQEKIFKALDAIRMEIRRRYARR